MRILPAMLLLILGTLILTGGSLAAGDNHPEEESALDCVFEKVQDVGSCLRTRLARDIDRIETQVTGKKSEPPISAVIEQAGSFVADLLKGDEEDGEEVEESNDQGEEGHGLEEARRKKFGKKKKKKHLQKLLALAMLFKAKLGLLLQLISTHFQLKFFIIGVISLILNATRFWLDLKKSNPSKVIYYEHAQHQHHYDHEDHDHGGYWGRSSDHHPEDIAYHAYAPEEH